MKTLPPFPVDDVTLLAVEHALGATLTRDAAGEWMVIGSDYTMTQLLNLLSGYDPALEVPMADEYGHEDEDFVEYTGGPIYHTDDIIIALIAEVRRLRDDPHSP